NSSSGNTTTSKLPLSSRDMLVPSEIGDQATLRGLSPINSQSVAVLAQEIMCLTNRASVMTHQRRQTPVIHQRRGGVPTPPPHLVLVESTDRIVIVGPRRLIQTRVLFGPVQHVIDRVHGGDNRRTPIQQARVNPRLAPSRSIPQLPTNSELIRPTTTRVRRKQTTRPQNVQSLLKPRDEAPGNQHITLDNHMVVGQRIRSLPRSTSVSPTLLLIRRRNRISVIDDRGVTAKLVLDVLGGFLPNGVRHNRDA